jgi:hypothetical protein
MFFLLDQCAAPMLLPWNRSAMLPFALSLTALSSGAQVLTSQYDNARTGANLHETVLIPQNVNAGQFGKLFSFPVDGDVYAQPLYVASVEVPGKGKRNLIFIVTEHDSVYAFDADGASTEPVWHVRFLDFAKNVDVVSARCAGVSRGVEMPHGISEWSFPFNFDRVFFFASLTGSVVEIRI